MGYQGQGNRMQAHREGLADGGKMKPGRDPAAPGR